MQRCRNASAVVGGGGGGGGEGERCLKMKLLGGEVARRQDLVRNG